MSATHSQRLGLARVEAADGAGGGRGLSGPRWVACVSCGRLWRSGQTCPDSRGASLEPEHGAGVLEVPCLSPHSQGSRSRTPFGKKDNVPLGLHPVPRGGNWVHPKNNPRCKQLPCANVFVSVARQFKGSAVSRCPNLLAFPGAERGLGDLAVLGLPSSGILGWGLPGCPLSRYLPLKGTPSLTGRELPVALSRL